MARRYLVTAVVTYRDKKKDAYISVYFRSACIIYQRRFHSNWSGTFCAGFGSLRIVLINFKSFLTCLPHFALCREVPVVEKEVEEVAEKVAAEKPENGTEEAAKENGDSEKPEEEASPAAEEEDDASNGDSKKDEANGDSTGE